MVKTKPASGSKSMAEEKQVAAPLRSFWFPDGTTQEAKTASEAAKIKAKKQ